MNKQSTAARRPVPKSPTTQAVVSKVQSITAKKNFGQQAGWVSNLQRVVDKGSQPTPATPSDQAARVERKVACAPVAEASKLDQAKDNTANQRNPNNEEFYKSRGMPGRPTDWDTPSRTPIQSKPGAKPSK